MKHHFSAGLRRLFTTSLALAFIVGNPFATARGDTTGTPWTGAPGITQTVAEIMAREKSAAVSGVRTPHPMKPLGRADRRGLVQNPSAPAAPQVAPGAGARIHERGPFAPQTLGTNFDTVTGPNETGAFPPDTMGAVGPSQFVLAINGRIRTFNKTTGLADGAINVGTDTFFAPVTTPVGGAIIGNFTSDPHVRYDRLSGRWFIVMIDVPYTSTSPFTTAENRVMIAVSNGSTIVNSGSFTFFQFRHDQAGPVGDTGAFADYPTPGIDANALYIGDNVFSNSTGAFVGCTGFVVRKTSLLGGGPIVVTAFRGLVAGSGEGAFTPQGVDNYDPAATEGYFVGVSNAVFGRLVVRRISNPGGTPTISADLLVTVPATRFPITVPHLGNTGGTNGNLDSLDDRLYAAHIRNGRLWTAHNIQVNTTGAASTTGGRNGSRWYELQNLNTTPALVESGTVFDPAASNPKSFWIPSIVVSGQGHVAMGFSTAGAANRVNAGTCGRLAGDTLGTMQAAVDYTATGTAYNPPGDPGPTRRWGDYSYTSVDPNDDMTLWTIQEYCNGTNTYGCRAVKLIAPPPATPVSCSPPSVSAGLASVSVMVTGAQVSGSGFFDPGAGFANRLASTISGGVTVNSVTYINPTTVSLSLNTTAAGAGAKNVTMTNPDGQALTGNGILTVNMPANNPPVANPDNFHAPLLPGPFNLNVLANDTDADMDPLSITATTNGAQGTVTFAGPNAIYTPGAGYTGNDAFTYTLSDTHTTVSGNVTISNLAPVANDDSASSATGAVSVFVLTNDTDADAGDAASFSIVSATNGASGTAAVAGDHIDYTPGAGFTGSDSFSYLLSDGRGDTANAVVSVTASAPFAVVVKGDLVGAALPGAVWNTFGHPAINDPDDLAFLAGLHSGDGGITSADNTGIFKRSSAGVVSVAAQRGQSAPGTDGAYYTFGDPTFNNAGHVAFIGKAKGGTVTSANDTCLWADGGGTMHLVAREGMLAPGTSAGEIFGTFLALEQTGSDRVAFFAKLEKGIGGVVSGNDSGIWAEAGDGSLVLVAREGDPIATPAGTKTIGTLYFLPKLSQTHGQTRGVDALGDLVFKAKFDGGIEGVFVALPATSEYNVLNVALRTSAVPSTPAGAIWKTFGQPAIGGTGSIGFYAYLQTGVGGITSANDAGLHGDAGTFLESLLREGDAAPDTASGDVFYKFDDFLNQLSTGKFAFPAALKKGVGDVTSDNDTGVWSNGLGALHLVAREGQLAPGTTSGEVFKKITSIGLPADGRVVFDGQLDSGFGGVTSATDHGIWAQDGGGTLGLLAREGSPLTVSGAAVNVTTLYFLPAASTVYPQTRGFNAGGHLTFKAKLDGGSYALFRVLR